MVVLFLREIAEFYGYYKPYKGAEEMATKYPDGSTYEGEFNNDKFHGKGYFTSPDGHTYEGEFNNDKFHGQGTLTYPDGAFYIGAFKDHKFHGQGTLTYPDGMSHQGEWVDGKLKPGTKASIGFPADGED